MTIQGIDTLKAHDPSEKLLNIGGLATRPASRIRCPGGAATALGLKPNTFGFRIKKLGLKGPC